jgi:hypothetical protein
MMPESKCHDVLKPRRGVILVAPPFKAGFSGTTHVSVPSRREGDKGDGVKSLHTFFLFAQANNIILKDLGESPQEYGLGRLPSWAIHNLPNLVSYISIG